MKRSIIAATAVTAALALFNITTASAEQYNLTGVVKSVNPIYTTVTQQVPTQTCNTVDVPIYGNNGSQGSSVFGLDLEGAIIGGVIGNNVTKNVENGGAAGAIIGGLIGSQNKKNNQRIVGYRQEQRCSTSYSSQQSQQFSHNEIVVDVDGFTVNARTARQNLRIGDTVPVVMSLQVR